MRGKRRTFTRYAPHREMGWPGLGGQRLEVRGGFMQVLSRRVKLKHFRRSEKKVLIAAIELSEKGD